MREVADGVWQIPLAPRAAVNAYLLGDVLVDAGTSSASGRVLRALEGRPLAAHAVTHAHPDHVGGSRAVIDARGVPMWAPAGDAGAIEQGRAEPAPTRLAPLMRRAGGFPAVPVARRLGEGDEVAGFRVLEVPGHSAGHVAFYRQADGVLVAGDVWFNLSFPTLRPGLRDPYRFLTSDPSRNRESQRRLAGLEPRVLCLGHGPVVADAAAKLRALDDHDRR